VAEKKSTRRSSSNGRPKPADLVREAATQLAQLTGRRPEGVVGLEKDDDGWNVSLEVLELERVPNSTRTASSWATSAFAAISGARRREVTGERRPRCARGSALGA
jgi:hypothetical protein